MSRSVSLKLLAQVALYGACAVSLTGFILNLYVEKKTRSTKTYQRAIEILRNHTATVNRLGEPIREGRIKFNISKDLMEFDVNLKGTKARGKLNCEYIVKPDKKTEITKVGVKFNDVPNKIFVIHEI